MYKRDYVDIATGLALTLIGAAAALYCASHYDLGEFSYMGPGMFPTGAGICLALFGLLIAVPAFARAGPHAELNVRAALAILTSVALFAATATRLGLVPAALAGVILSTFGDTKLGILQALLLGLVLSGLAWLIFVVGLGISLPAFRAPW